MTTLRQPYYELSPAVYNALVQAKTALENRRCGSRSNELTRHLAQKSRFIKEKITGQHRNMLAFLASRSAQPMS